MNVHCDNALGCHLAQITILVKWDAFALDARQRTSSRRISFGRHRVPVIGIRRVVVIEPTEPTLAGLETSPRRRIATVALARTCHKVTVRIAPASPPQGRRSTWENVWMKGVQVPPASGGHRESRPSATQ